MRSFFGRSDFPRPIVTWAGLQLSCHELRLFGHRRSWGCRKSLRHPWNKRSFFALTGVARLDVSDAPEGSIYFGCPLTQHLQLFNLLCAKEQRACVLGESDCVWGVRGCDKFHGSLTPSGMLVRPKVRRIVGVGVGVGCLPKNATCTFSSDGSTCAVRWVVNNAVLPLGCCC